MKDEALRELVREVVREELARYFRAGMDVLEKESAEDEAGLGGALALLEQHEDVMSSWMDWASDEEDGDDWQDFDDD